MILLIVLVYTNVAGKHALHIQKKYNPVWLRSLKSLQWGALGGIFAAHGPRSQSHLSPPTSDAPIMHNTMNSWWKFNFPQWLVVYSALWHLNSWTHSHWAVITPPLPLFVLSALPAKLIDFDCCFCALINYFQLWKRKRFNYKNSKL